MIVLLPARKAVYPGLYFMQSYKDMTQDTTNVGDLELKSDHANKLRHVENYVENVTCQEGPGLATNVFHFCLFVKQAFKTLHILPWCINNNNKSTPTICCTLRILILMHPMMPCLMVFLTELPISAG